MLKTHEQELSSAIVQSELILENLFKFVPEDVNCDQFNNQKELVEFMEHSKSFFYLVSLINRYINKAGGDNKNHSDSNDNLMHMLLVFKGLLYALRSDNNLQFQDLISHELMDNLKWWRIRGIPLLCKKIERLPKNLEASL